MNWTSTFIVLSNLHFLHNSPWIGAMCAAMAAINYFTEKK